MRANRRYDSTTGRPGARDIGITPYCRLLHAFADNVNNGRNYSKALARFAKYETCIFVTGTQSGKTDTMLDIIGWRVAVRARPQLYVGPSREFVNDQFEPRLKIMLDGSEDIIEDEFLSKKRIKLVNGVRIRLAWGGSATSLASDQAADIYVDEYDKMFRAQRRAGDPLILAKARADTYADRKIFVTSTPETGIVHARLDPKSGLEFWEMTEPDRIESRMWRRWQTGTRHHLAWRCPHCSEWFVPRFAYLEWPEGASPGVARRETYLRCPHNGCVIEESSKAEMNENWQAVAPGEIILPDGTIEGEPLDTDTLSFWASGLASPFITWGERVQEFLDAEQSGEPEAKQAAMNKVGELYSPIDLRQATPDDLAKSIGRYSFGFVPQEVLRITLGCDVQKNRLVYVVRGWGSRSRSWLLEAVELFGLTSESEVWATFSQRLLKTYGGLRIEKALIDAGFRPDKRDAGDYHRVLDFCRRHSWVAQATRGKGTQSVPIIVKREEYSAEGKAEKYGIETLAVNTDYFKTMWFSRLFSQPGEPGAVVLPQDVSSDYCKQVISEIRGDDGIWHQVYRQNHFLDAEVLATVGGYMLQVQHIPDGTIRETDNTAVAMPGEVPAGLVAAKSLQERMAAMSGRFNKRA